MLSKTSVDLVFSHHFEKMSSASAWGLRPLLLPESCPWTLLGDFRPSDPLIATPRNNHAGTHACEISELTEKSAFITTTHKMSHSLLILHIFYTTSRQSPETEALILVGDHLYLLSVAESSRPIKGGPPCVISAITHIHRVSISARNELT